MWTRYFRQHVQVEKSPLQLNSLLERSPVQLTRLLFTRLSCRQSRSGVIGMPELPAPLVPPRRRCPLTNRQSQGLALVPIGVSKVEPGNWQWTNSVADPALHLEGPFPVQLSRKHPRDALLHHMGTYECQVFRPASAQSKLG
jgi:hypothetical protein